MNNTCLGAVNGQQVRIFIVTGADVSAISQEFVQRNGCQLRRMMATLDRRFLAYPYQSLERLQLYWNLGRRLFR